MFQEEAQIRLSRLQRLVLADCRNGQHARCRETKQHKNTLVNNTVFSNRYKHALWNTHIFLFLLGLFCKLSCYGSLTWMAFSSNNGFLGSSGVNTWGAAWPGLLWGQQWVKLGQDVVAGRSLQLQTPMTLVTLWKYHSTLTVPQNCSYLSWWFCRYSQDVFLFSPWKIQIKKKREKNVKK